MNQRQFFILLYFAIAISLMVHHYIICGRFWDIDQFMHHEVVEIGFIGGAIALIIQSQVPRVRRALGC